MLVKGGALNVTTYFAMRLVADGTAATGLTPADFDLQYVRSGEAPSVKQNATLNANGIGGNHSDATVIEVDATDQPGLYRIDWLDGAFVAGVREAILSVKVATAFTEHLRVEIDAEVNVAKWLGTAVTAGTAGTPDVNTARIFNNILPVLILERWLNEGKTSTADSGTTTTLVDTSLSEADDHWKGALLVFTTGTNNGYTAIGTDFDAATDTLTFTPAVPNAVTTEDYILIPGLGWSDVRAVGGTVQTAGDLAALIATVDGVADAIKVVMDKFVFTVANEVDANTKSINDAEVVGDGNATPWDGA